MAQGSDDLDKLKLFTERQDEEAKLHWSRNSYFLVVMSILMVAFGLRPVENHLQLSLFRILIALGGVALCGVWLLIQHRSSKYVLYYKTEARRLAKSTNTTDVYPQELGGIEIRKLAYALPIVFLLVWLAFIVMVAATL